MTTYNTDNIGLLANDIRKKPAVVSKALADTINKSATFAIRASIDEITKEVTLQPSYVKGKIKTVARAKYDNLRAVVNATERGTLLTRFSHHKTMDGYAVSVNRTGGFRKIKGAKLLKGLRGSGASGIALRNKDAVAFFQQSVSKGNRTPEKSRKLQRIISKARTKPFGWTVLHSRSINQLFTSVREDVQPELKSFMVSTFILDLDRYDK